MDCFVVTLLAMTQWLACRHCEIPQGIGAIHNLAHKDIQYKI
ncbi:hypothetical protein [Helicobacter sp.]|nr:hypothetical protein [Helicobacter sp.]